MRDVCAREHACCVRERERQGHITVESVTLWRVTSCSCIDKIPEEAKTSLRTKEIFFIKVKTLSHPLKRLIQTRPHMSTSRYGNICIRPGFSNRSSVDAAVSGRRCEQQRILWTSVS